MATPRLTYEDSCRRLQPTYLDAGDIPRLPDRMPRGDDDNLGISFFRTFVGEGDDLGNLTLPRTYFGHSEIRDASFRNTDLAESSLCWNDFVDVDFSEATLARSDLRASSFTGVRFVAADLTGADLRRSTFLRCDFTDAVMAGAVLTHAQGEQLNLSGGQRSEIAWTGFDGPEPSGG